MNNIYTTTTNNANIEIPAMTLWVDADACPRVIKDIIYKISARLNLKTILVANDHLTIPISPFISLIKVKKDLDAADHYIVEHVQTTDVVITADIPLAALVVGKGSVAIDVRGEIYTEENVQERLSIRDFAKTLRDSGLQIAGPAIFQDKDKIKFTNSLNNILTKKLKK